jgi:hypothetical protein
VGGATDGLSPEVVRAIAGIRGCSDGEAEEWYLRNKVKIARAQNRHALKAFGNAVVPQVVEEVGRVLVSVVVAGAEVAV